MLLYEKYYKGKDKKTFLEAVNKYAEKLQIPADWLMAVMYSESSLNPQSKNDLGYVGLIQFGEATRKDLGVTKEKILGMNGTSQMEYVYKYFSPFAERGLINEFTDLYLITFYPNAGKRFGGTLKKPDDWKFPSKVTEANPGIWTNKDTTLFDKSEDISIGSFKKWAESKISAEDKNKIVGKTNNKQQVVVNKPSETQPQEERAADDFIIYIHNYSNIKTLKELITYKEWVLPGQTSPPSPTDLLNFKDNEDSIKKSHSKRGLKTAEENLENNLVVGTRLKIPISWVQTHFIPFDGSQNIFPNDDIETFISTAMEKAVTSPEYVKAFNSGEIKGSVIKKVPRPRVWIWCKSLGIKEGSGEEPKFSAKGEIFDLSPFITNLTTTVGGQGGTFSFNLPPLICKCTETGWVINKSTIKEFNSSKGNAEKNFTAKGFVNRLTPTGLKRNNFFFHQLINHNDIVFISLDTPENEPIEGLRKWILENDITNPKIDKTLLPGNFYDMIGLVDSNVQNYNSVNSAVSINVTGRDCFKLLIEESSYYISIPDEQEKLNQTQGIFVNDNPENWGRPFRTSRLQMTSPIFNLAITAARTVGEMMSFIISSLASIEIAPDSLFEGYQKQEEGGQGFGISRYEFYDVRTKEHQLFRAAGIWQIIKLQIDDQAVNDRTVIDHKLAVHSGSLLNGMKMFADGRFIEIFGDTYIDQYFLLVRRPPINKKGVYDYLTKLTNKKQDGRDNGQEIDDGLVVSENLSWYNNDVYSWYRLNLPRITAGGKSLPATRFPIVFFREYCEIWGNKALDVQSNYLPINKVRVERGEEKSESAFETQLYEDLAFLVESNAYLPFTRQGTITIKGERRIKRGTWIRYKPTNEIFYVESVTQNYAVNQKNVERTTTIQVSRGMVEKNVSGQSVLPLYFQIISGLPNSNGEEKPEIKKENVEVKRLNVYFDFDKDVLIDPYRDPSTFTARDLIHDLNKREELRDTGEKAINDLIDNLHSIPNFKAKIIGHTDENGSVEYNQDLSRRRAETVKWEVIRRWNNRFTDKLDPSRITTVGKGESQPLETHKNTDGDEKRRIDALNRRIEVEISKPDEMTNNKQSPANKENDFSKWRVNQSVFNFFLSRRQFCSHVEGIEELGDLTERVNGAELIRESANQNEAVNGTIGDKEASDGVSSSVNPANDDLKAYLYKNEDLLNKIATESRNKFIAGRLDDGEITG